MPLNTNADDGRTYDLAHIVKGAELIPKRQRRRIGGAQVADRLCQWVIAGVSQRRKYYRRRV